ncbi:MAG: DPP IV N-terminal domain-containing protein [Armatimonas sp.]
MHRTISVAPLMALLLCIGPVLAQGTKADYERAARLREKLRGKVSGLTLTPRWQADGKLWYRVGNQFAVVDPKQGRKTLQKELPGAATTLNPRNPGELPRSISGGEATQIVLENKASFPVRVFWLDTEGGRREYAKIQPGKEWSSGTYAGHVWLVTREDESPLVGFVAEQDVLRGQIAGTTPERQARRRGGDPTLSPDGKWRVRFEGSNAVLLATAGGDPVPLTKDGVPEDYYEGPVRWSPDSHYFTISRTIPGDGRKIPIVSSAPRDQVQPKWRLVPYDKPGDKLAISHPHVFEVGTKAEVLLPALESVTPNPFNLDDAEWTPDSSRFYLRYNERGHQLYRIIEVTPKTGASRVLIEERAKTFIDWTNKVFFQPLFTLAGKRFG